jgi:hypothetical protein
MLDLGELEGVRVVDRLTRFGRLERRLDRVQALHADGLGHGLGICNRLQKAQAPA